MAQLGMGCTLLSVCWIGGQLCYNGVRTIKARKVNSSLGVFCAALCCGHTALQGERDDNAMKEHWMELNNSMDLRRNRIEEKIAWASESSDTCEEVEMIVTGELEEIDNDPVSQGHRLEKRERSQKI